MRLDKCGRLGIKSRLIMRRCLVKWGRGEAKKWTSDCEAGLIL